MDWNILEYKKRIKAIIVVKKYDNESMLAMIRF